ncbi:hypothetical protein O4H61_03480 [Roseovarius aestuarii]|nr:hypothetical protein [Roseovarius aestuarii]
MPAFNTIVHSEVRRLARKGKLMDTCFKIFQRQVYPGAPPHQITDMRICFFAGATELFEVMTAGMDDGVSETDGDLAFMKQWTDELEDFHRRTIAASQADTKGTPQ